MAEENSLKKKFNVSALPGYIAATGLGLAAPWILPPLAGAAGIAFSSPAILAGLGAVPPAIWLMKNILHKPRQELFPALALLRNLPSLIQKPKRMPLIQTILRSTALSAAILG